MKKMRLIRWIGSFFWKKEVIRITIINSGETISTGKLIEDAYAEYVMYVHTKKKEGTITFNSHRPTLLKYRGGEIRITSGATFNLTLHRDQFGGYDRMLHEVMDCHLKHLETTIKAHRDLFKGRFLKTGKIN